MHPFLQYLLPQHAISVLLGLLANSKITWLKNFFIRRFVKKYHVDLTEAVVTDPNAYPTFNAFFIRELKQELRPIAAGDENIISPVDGTIAAIGEIKQQQLLQAKGFYYQLNALLGNDQTLADYFANGSFCTIYLAPNQYHRVHMPLSGYLQKTIYVPGKLFSVNRKTTEYIPNLYTRNERLIAHFQTKAGAMAVVFVGAMIVGNIHTSWSKTPARTTTPAIHLLDHALYFDKGAELGYFSIGSTIVLLFEKNKINFKSTAYPGSNLLFGQFLGNLIK